jgi:hypothetical protein
MIILIINENTNYTILKIWMKYYIKNNISFIVYTKDYHILPSYFLINNDEYNKYITNNEIVLNNDKSILITEYDFLVSYTINNEKETINLSMNLTDNDLECECSIVGKVFYVPVPNKQKYTTFEIPDFILYQHSNHTNYTIDGIKINGGEKVSDKIVCISLKTSPVAVENEYYENNILFENTICKTVYLDYEYNIFLNKEKMYGVIWHLKCACSTICNLFIKINDITIQNDVHSLNNLFLKYRYNNYLQNFDMVSFIRHPYFRFISCYFNKHVDKTDDDYLKLEGYNKYLLEYDNQDTLLNLITYLNNGNSIDHHTTPIYKMSYFNKYTNLKYKIRFIEKDLNNYLYKFLSKYHILQNNKFENLNYTTKNESNPTPDLLINTNFKYYNTKQWNEYKNTNYVYPNYLEILDEKIIDKLNIFYKNDLEMSNYPKNLLGIINKNIPEDFVSKDYIELNEDLKHMTEIEVKTHYKYYGYTENRKYKYENIPEDFVSKDYIELNEDLKHMTEIESKKHYNFYGYKENRKYKYENIPEDFVSKDYKELNN